jgi:hypothetical protein
MIGRTKRIGLLFYALALALLSAPHIAAQTVAREDLGVRVTAVDATGFPTVRVRVLTTGPGSAPVADTSRLLLRENGVPIPEATLGRAPVGVDLVLVIDANVDLLQADEPGGATRRDKVAESITRFAGQNMNPDGLDRVSIIAPDAARLEPTFLTQDATQPDEVAAAVAAYDAAPPADQPLRPTPLQAMLAAAIDHLAARQEDGRFGAVLLYTDGARLDRQLDAPALAAAAQTAGVPLFAAILGAAVSPEEQANVGALTEPTNGQAIHMPTPADADSLYALFAAQGTQIEMVYQSALRQNGPQQVAVNLGNVRDAAEFELALAGPTVTLDAPPTVRRAGSAVDTPLALLQPAVLPLTAVVTWPEGQSRQLTAIVFLVDGLPQPQAAPPAADAAGRIPLVWDISEREAGTYRLSVEVVDELGFSAAAAPLAVTIEVVRPSPPTPTAAPTAAPVVETAPGPARLLLPLLLLALAGGALLWGVRRARRGPAAPPTPAVAPPPPPPPAGHVAVLEWAAPGETGGEAIELLADNVTLGREAGAVDIVLDDPAVSRLHARIRRDATGVYWLYDEGSAAGTFLNHEQLGLAPRPLQHGDLVQLGRPTLRFRLELAGWAGRAASSGQPDTEEWTADGADFTDGHG